MQEVYLANRQLKAPNVDNADEETRIQCTLLEYGRRFGASKIPKAQKDDAVKKKLEGGQSEEGTCYAQYFLSGCEMLHVYLGWVFLCVQCVRLAMSLAHPRLLCRACAIVKAP